MQQDRTSGSGFYWRIFQREIIKGNFFRKYCVQYTLQYTQSFKYCFASILLTVPEILLKLYLILYFICGLIYFSQLKHHRKTLLVILLVTLDSMKFISFK